MHPVHISYRYARSQLIGLGAMMAVIYLVYVIFLPLIPTIDTSDTVLDIEMQLRDGRRWFAPLYVLGLGLLFYSYWRTLKIVHTFSQENPGAAKSLRGWVLGIGVLCGIILLGLYPITALDVVLYVVRARLWALYDGSPMIALPASFPQDPYIGFAGEYARQPSPYGPLWELVAQIPIRMGLTRIAAGIISMKVISLISYICMAILLGWHAQQDTPRYNVSHLTVLGFFALNPLVLMEAIGNGHNDMLMLALMTLGLVLWQRDKWVWATVALTLAALIKVTGLILLPLFGIAVLSAASNWRMRLLRALGMAAIFLVLSLIAYRLTGPFPDVFDGVRQAMFGRLGYTPSYAIRILLRHLFPGQTAIIQMPTHLGNNLFIIYYAYLLIRLVTRKISLIEAGFLAYFSQLILGSAFRIWYPIWLIPFAALNLNSGTYWRTFLFSFTAELSILMYYILWRWILRAWDWGVNGPLQNYWDYWLIMTWLTVPWTFGIPILGPMFRRWKDRRRFDDTLSV